MSGADVVVVGSFVQDHAWFTDSLPQRGETRRALGFNTGPGGKGFNQAVTCLRQGVSTLFVGALGDDHLGAIAQRFAESEGLLCRWQIRSDVPTATSGIVVDRDGPGVQMVDLGANEHIDPAFLRALEPKIARAKLILVQLENNLDAIAAALDIATRHGLIRMMNPAPVHPDIDAVLLHRCDLVTPNETEFALLIERFTDERVAAATLTDRNDADLHRLARKLGVDTVVVTLGARGCFVSHADASNRRGDDSAFYRLAAETVVAIDSTGAGDAFSGSLAAAMLRFEGRPFRDAVLHANRAAAMSTESVGTAPVMPRFDEVVRRFSG